MCVLSLSLPPSLPPSLQNEDWDRIFGDSPKSPLPTKEPPSSKTKKVPNSPEARKRMEVSSEPLPLLKSPSRKQGEKEIISMDLLKIENKLQVSKSNECK